MQDKYYYDKNFSFDYLKMVLVKLQTGHRLSLFSAVVLHIGPGWPLQLCMMDLGSSQWPQPEIRLGPLTPCPRLPEDIRYGTEVIYGGLLQDRDVQGLRDGQMGTRESVLEDSEADLCCIPSQQHIKLTLLFVTFLLFVVAFLLLVAWTWIFLSFVCSYKCINFQSGCPVESVPLPS